MNMKPLLVLPWVLWPKGLLLLIFVRYNLCIAVFSKWSAYVSSSAGPVPRSECVLSPVNDSHPVHALLESFTVLSGCASRGTTGLPQEVHVLNLRNPEEGLGNHEREVKGKLPFIQIPGYKCVCKWERSTLICWIKLFLNCDQSDYKEGCAVCMDAVHLCFVCHMSKPLPYPATLSITFHNHEVYLKRVVGWAKEIRNRFRSTRGLIELAAFKSRSFT